MKPKTTGELRAHLADAMRAVARGDMTAREARDIADEAKRINREVAAGAERARKSRKQD
jgi:polyhydroxyalkanoate synthesis regulator phasin